MTALSTLARMLGVRRDLAEDALHSERAAKAVLSRRSLFAAAGAMASGAAFGEVRGLGQGTLTLTAKAFRLEPGSDMWLMAEAVTGVCLSLTRT
jgi:hypothetical protein